MNEGFDWQKENSEEPENSEERPAVFIRGGLLFEQLPEDMAEPEADRTRGVLDRMTREVLDAPTVVEATRGLEDALVDALDKAGRNIVKEMEDNLEKGVPADKAQVFALQQILKMLRKKPSSDDDARTDRPDPGFGPGRPDSPWARR